MIELATVLTLSKEEKIEQIEIRQQLISQMSGQLWPSVLRDEIIQIQKSM